MCYNALQPSGGTKDGSQRTILLENRTCLPGLKEREIDSFRNLTWLTCWLGEAALSGMRRWTGEWDMPDQNPHPLPSCDGAYFIPGILLSNKSSLQQDNEIPVENE